MQSSGIEQWPIGSRVIHVLTRYEGIITAYHHCEGQETVITMQYDNGNHGSCFLSRMPVYLQRIDVEPED